MIQLQFLNRLIKTRDASLITINNIDKSFFSDYEKEFTFIVDHYTEYGNIPDAETFVHMFPDFDIVDVHETDRFLLDALFKDKKMRLMAGSYNKAKNLMLSDKADQAMAELLSAAEKVTQITHLEAVDILHDDSRYNRYIEKSEDFKKFYVSTGIKELDAIIGGWDRQEELATIIARPGVGKSWILLKIALAAAEQGLTVGLYSGEMSEDKVGFRIDTLYGHTSNTKIIHGNRNIQNEYKKQLDDMSKNIKGKLKVITPKMFNGTIGVNALRSFIEKEKIDILCIDQHSLLEDDRGSRDPVVRASNISKDLKKLQVLKRIPIISVSQANRQSNKKGEEKVEDDDLLSLENISQSDRIGQDSTVVLGLTQKDSVLSIKLIKSRDSIAGTVFKYAVDFDKGIFNYIPSEKDGIEACEEVKDRYETSYDTGGDEF